MNWESATRSSPQTTAITAAKVHADSVILFLCYPEHFVPADLLVGRDTLGDDSHTGVLKQIKIIDVIIIKCYRAGTFEFARTSMHIPKVQLAVLNPSAMRGKSIGRCLKKEDDPGIDEVF